MGFVSGLLGTAGGAGGTGFSGPQNAPLLNPASEQMGKDALAQQQALINAYQPGGTAALASQQDLLAQLGQASQGQGPNPALAQFAQSTAANTANQAALMAGQRGSAMNPALIARQAAQQGAQNQQNAAGQAATLAAQQQIAARQALAAQQAQMVGQQQAGQQQYTGNVLSQINSQNQANLGNQQNINQVNAGLANTVMGGQNNLMGQLTGGIGSAMGLAGAAEGGQVGHLPMMPETMAQGGPVSGPKSRIGQYMSGNKPIPQAMPVMAPQAAMAEGGKVPVLVSPGEQHIPKEEISEVKTGKKSPLEAGDRIPGKPQHPGNDYRNDTVPRKYNEGDLIIPNSVMQSKNPHWEAMKFVHAHTRSLKKGK